MAKTYRVYRQHAIDSLKNKGRWVFDSDSNERLAHELWEYKSSDDLFHDENYEVVDFEQENEPEDDKWDYWKYGI